MRYLFPLVMIGALALPAAAQDKKKDEKPPEPIKIVKIDRKDPVVYEKDIQPILTAKCVGCHGKELKESKLDLRTYDDVMKGGKNGAAIVPGKPDDSLLIKLAGRTPESLTIKLSGKTEPPTMPPKDYEALIPEELALIKLWVTQGAKGPTTRIVRPAPTLGTLPDQVKPVVAVAVSPDKSTVAAGRGSQIHVYDAGSGNFVRSLVNPDLKDAKGNALPFAHLDIVQSIAFSPDGRLLASGGFQEVVLWDVQTGTLRSKLTGFMDRVVALSFSKDGKFLATGGGPPSEEGEIKVFEVETGKQLLDIKPGHSDTVFGVCFSPDDKMLATCGADKFVKVWEIPSGKFVKSFEGHTHHVLDVGWKGDGKVLASAGADNVIKVWTFETGEQARTMQGHTKQVTRLLFIGTTGQIVTASGDATVRKWNTDNGGNLGTFPGNTDYVYAVGVSADGAVVAAGGQEGVVRLYNGANLQLLKTLVAPTTQPEEPKK